MNQLKYFKSLRGIRYVLLIYERGTNFCRRIKYKGKLFSQNWYVKREEFGSPYGTSQFRILSSIYGKKKPKPNLTHAKVLIAS